MVQRSDPFTWRPPVIQGFLWLMTSSWPLVLPHALCSSLLSLLILLHLFTHSDIRRFSYNYHILCSTSLLDPRLPQPQASNGKDWGPHIEHPDPENRHTTGVCAQPCLLYPVHSWLPRHLSCKHGGEVWRRYHRSWSHIGRWREPASDRVVLVLDTSKTTEVIVDFRRSRTIEHPTSHPPRGGRVGGQSRVPEHPRHIWPYVVQTQTAYLLKKAQQRLFLLRKLKRNPNPNQELLKDNFAVSCTVTIKNHKPFLLSS